MKIRITNETGNALDSKITYNGEPLPGCSKCVITLDANNPMARAELEFILVPFSVLAEASIRLEHLRELANVHGYDLVKLRHA